MSFAFEQSPDQVLARLQTWRQADSPTAGGRILAYVFDTGVAELDRLAARAAQAMLPVNGLDPVAFPSTARLEREVVAFVRDLAGGHGGRGDDAVVGAATTGGTESNLLAVKTARDLYLDRPDRPTDRPKLVLPTTAHGSFRKAAHYFGLAVDLAPTAADGLVDPAAVIARLGEDVALVVASAPAYPFGGLDPVAAVAAAAWERGLPCHVDACMGGLSFPFWPGAEDLPAWDFRLPGVTSLSLDLHKFGFAPKGVSVLLQRGRARQRRQFSACADWAGYPLVGSTMLGSKSACSLAAAWAIICALGRPGFARLTAQTARAAAAIAERVEAIEGLRVFSRPTGPMLALAADPRVAPDRRVDPHHWADALRALGWTAQLQPGLAQADGPRLPPTAHLTATPVTESRLPQLLPALARAADQTRGRPPADGAALRSRLEATAGWDPTGPPDAWWAAWERLAADRAAETADARVGPTASDQTTTTTSDTNTDLTTDDVAGGAGGPGQADWLALLEALPARQAESLLIGRLASLAEA
ncbi:MAG: aspartate aminotransferase family protein [Propionibacteriaceae bacterium]|jgi:glutamate/tyrosine decarboxylase-like PLP-dependent enzyme|nr:aspartate aminotransferase family protein [Propionibacteriaceae bacterium]